MEESKSVLPSVEDAVRALDHILALDQQSFSVQEIRNILKPIIPSAEEANKSAKVLLQYFWAGIQRDMSDLERWGKLAESPKDFDAELKRVLSQIRSAMKAFYGIEGHHPTKNARRDAEIWREQQEHPDRSLAQIGRNFKLSGPAVKSALNRHAKRQRRALEGLRSTATFLKSELYRAILANFKVEDDEAIDQPS